MSDTDQKLDPLTDAKRIMGNLARTPHKPHVPKTSAKRQPRKKRTRKNAMGKD
jgi:hypothetical protein